MRSVSRQSFILVFLLSLCFMATAQPSEGKVDIVQDTKIKELVNEHVTNSDLKGTIAGYRVQVYFGSEREKSMEIKAKFLRSYPDVPAYETYQPPNFKIRVGDFRSRRDAQKFLKELNETFSGSFIVTDEINYPKLY